MTTRAKLMLCVAVIAAIGYPAIASHCSLSVHFPALEYAAAASTGGSR